MSKPEALSFETAIETASELYGCQVSLPYILGLETFFMHWRWTACALADVCCRMNDRIDPADPPSSTPIP
jgi:hypothetical protein